MATTQYYGLLIIEGSSLIGALANDNPQKIDAALHGLDVDVTALKNRVPAPGSGDTSKFLRGDSTWQSIPLPAQATSSSLGTLKIGYTTSGKNYALQLDSSGKGYVNVPWTDTTYADATTSAHGLMTAADKTKLNGIATGAQVNPGAATSSAYGLVKIGYSTNGKNYAVQLSDGKMYVNVPWTDNNTTYSEATSTNYGLVKTGYSTNGKNYAVQLSSGKMYVNVPWTDTNTTYSNFGGTNGSNTGSAGLVPAPTSNYRYATLIGEGHWCDLQDVINVVQAKAYSGIQNTNQKIEFRLGNQDNVAAINGEVAVNFSPAFSNGCHVVIPVLRSNLNGVFNRFACYDWTKTGFKYKAQNGSSANISFTWFAIGY